MERNIKTDNPSADEISGWFDLSDGDTRKFFNTSGQLYKKMGLKEKLAEMTEREQAELLASDGMLVKRPILAGEGFVLAGFKEALWEEKLLS